MNNFSDRHLDPHDPPRFIPCEWCGAMLDQDNDEGIDMPPGYYGYYKTTVYICDDCHKDWLKQKEEEKG